MRRGAVLTMLRSSACVDTCSSTRVACGQGHCCAEGDDLRRVRTGALRPERVRRRGLCDLARVVRRIRWLRRRSNVATCALGPLCGELLLRARPKRASKRRHVLCRRIKICGNSCCGGDESCVVRIVCRRSGRRATPLSVGCATRRRCDGVSRQGKLCEPTLRRCVTDLIGSHAAPSPRRPASSIRYRCLRGGAAVLRACDECRGHRLSNRRSVCRRKAFAPMTWPHIEPGADDLTRALSGDLDPDRGRSRWRLCSGDHL